ncbi:hypothetical protein P43SY_005961 [Pythium insidiosum]|uniref:Lipase-like C-terminal domain-containing protein n=1 Tax=Pythium insidiosum TaxID=114742 RepID=A0AAD5LYN0_PYTIN|nr:hypothetical protein P43SY_005961 [Pythium insidiosum]
MQLGSYLSALLVLCATATQVVFAANKYPVVLVHGLAGWGRGEFGGANYFGLLHDFEAKLKADGYEVLTVGIGKVTSNWHRACEIYAQLKGGRVDYGENHAKTFGHARFGRNYTALYPQWGTVVNGEVQKVHLVGHSMGGTTARMLTQLLNHGTKGATVTESASSHPLFAGGKDWVHSVTTMATPNQGTTLADDFSDFPHLIQDVVSFMMGAAGLLGDTSARVYDPMLDQWGITPKQPGEGLGQYIQRVMSSKVLAPGTKDNARYSLTTEGARAENKWVKTLPNVYYYSYITEGTFDWVDIFLRKIALPNPAVMFPVLYPFATAIGSRNTVSNDFSEDWLPNDGLVNVPSQIGDGQGAVVSFNGRSQRGVWSRFKTLKMDHAGIIGWNPLIKVYDMYRAHAALLTDLPAHEEPNASRRLRDEAKPGHQAPAEILQAFEHAFATYNADVPESPFVPAKP